MLRSFDRIDGAMVTGMIHQAGSPVISDGDPLWCIPFYPTEFTAESPNHLIMSTSASNHPPEILRL
jgi:hypothetical protein